MGAVRCIRAFQPLLKEVRGSIVNVSSVHGSIPRNAPCYSTTKAALENLTQRLAVEFGKDGIRVNAVAPGWIDTEGVRWSLIDQAAVDSAIDQFIPLGRLGTAEEVASVILFLLQAEASYVTGSVWRADGGWLSV